MRPRVIPAEDRPDGHRRRDGRVASMRPRVIPAEDAGSASEQNVLDVLQ